MKVLYRLMRMHQWYKNLVIFIPLIFAEKLFVPTLLFKEVIGFIALCLMSSCNYIINDIKDVEKDRKHPEKRKRPIAAGRISRTGASFTAVVLLITSLTLAFQINETFFLWPLALFCATQLYSLKFRKIAIMDVHFIALNFLIRITAGSIAIDVPSSPWLYLLAFLVALFLSFGKRISELRLLKGKASSHRGVYKIYSDDLLLSFESITTAVLLASYCFYTFQAGTGDGKLMFTIPFVTFIIFRYLYLIKSDSKIARKTELFIFDRQLLIASIGWLFWSIFLIYYF